MKRALRLRAALLLPGSPQRRGGPLRWLDRQNWPQVFILVRTGPHPAVVASSFQVAHGEVAIDHRLSLVLRDKHGFAQAAPGEWVDDSIDGLLRHLQQQSTVLKRALRLVLVQVRTAAQGRAAGATLKRHLFLQGKHGYLLGMAGRSAQARVDLFPPSPSQLRRIADPLIATLGGFVNAPGVRLPSSEVCFVEGSGGALQLCNNLMVLPLKEGVWLYHRCDELTLTLSAQAAHILPQLLRGTTFNKLVQDVWRRAGDALEVSEVREFVEMLEAQRLMHRAPLPAENRLAVANRTLASAREQVPSYRDYPKSVAAAPFINAATVRADWAQFTARGHDLSDPRRYTQGGSGGSTAGASLSTVVEAEVNARRNRAERSISWKECFLISRPANQGHSEEGEWPKAKINHGMLAVSPGPNPTAIPAAVWDRTVELLVRKNPDLITGDPSYVAGLARRCLTLGVRLPRLVQVNLTHAYAWEIYRSIIAQAFGVPLGQVYNASETRTMAVGCTEGQLHWTARHLYFEVLREGRPVRPGEVGALVITTLDTAARPLIRYALGDLVRLVGPHCRCGRPGPIVQPVGRVRHLFANRQGQPVTYEDLDRAVGAPLGISYLRFDIYRERAKLSLVPTGAPSLVDLASLTQRVEAVTGRRLQVEFVAQLEVPHQGKLPLIDTEDLTNEWYGRLLGTPPLPRPLSSTG